MSNLFPMTAEQYEAYLKSVRWRALRDKVLKRDSWKCTECRSKYNLHAHHLTYDRVGEEQLEDLKTLCRKCHSARHKGDLIIKLIKLCCERFLSQKPSEDYNPFHFPQCHGCGKTFEEYEEIRYYYGPGTYCESCIGGVKEQLKKSRVPHYINEIVVDYRGG